MFISPSFFISKRISTFKYLSRFTSTISQPASIKGRCLSLSVQHVAIIVRAESSFLFAGTAVLTTYESSGIRRFESHTMRIGFLPPFIRQVSFGLSAITVPAPTITDAYRLRISCTLLCDFSQLILHFLPGAYEIFPSKVIAYFIVTYGILVVIKLKKILLISSHSFFKIPSVTSIP